MSKPFWQAIALICISFALYETGVNFYLRRLHDRTLEQCTAPAEVTRGQGLSA